MDFLPELVPLVVAVLNLVAVLITRERPPGRRIERRSDGKESDTGRE